MADYGRDNYYKKPLLWGIPVTVILGVLNLMVFLLAQLNPPSGRELGILGALGLSLINVFQDGAFHTFVTYGFLHLDFYHFLFNGLVLVMIGAIVERRMGSLRYAIFYMVTLVGAGVITFGYHFFIGDINFLVGASGALFGVLLAYAVFFPDNRLLIYGIIPVRARFLFLGYIGLSLFYIFFGLQRGISHMGHLSGAIVGWIYFLVVFRINPWNSFFGPRNRV